METFYEWCLAIRKLKKSFYFLMFLLFPLSLSSDYYSSSKEDEARILRFPVWVFIEGQPGTMQEGEGQHFTSPKDALEEITYFLIYAMCYGYNFYYTPQDNMRGVKEDFRIEKISSIEVKKENIKIKEVKIKYPYVHTWVEYTLELKEDTFNASWTALNYKSTKGRGEGKRQDETMGVRNAYISAIKNAVVAYAKKSIKNKPKELKGEFLIKNSPRLFCASGLFNAEVELYINIKEIIPYQAF